MNKKANMPTMESVKAFREKLKTESGVFGPFMITSDPAFVEAAGYAGYDFVLLDMEHGPGTFENLQNLIRAANVSGVTPIVRVPRGSDIWIDQALDVGAGGVMIPQIDNAERIHFRIAAKHVHKRPGQQFDDCKQNDIDCHGQHKAGLHRMQRTILTIRAKVLRTHCRDGIAETNARQNCKERDLLRSRKRRRCSNAKCIGDCGHERECKNID